MLDPDMPAQELRLHMGELTASELRVARRAIRWANSAIMDDWRFQVAQKIDTEHFKNCEQISIKIVGDSK